MAFLPLEMVLPAWFKLKALQTVSLLARATSTPRATCPTSMASEVVLTLIRALHEMRGTQGKPLRHVGECKGRVRVERTNGGRNHEVWWLRGVVQGQANDVHPCRKSDRFSAHRTRRIQLVRVNSKEW